MDQVLSEDIPKLLKMFPKEMQATDNPFQSRLNPFSQPEIIKPDLRSKSLLIFNSLEPVDGKVSGEEVK